MKLLIGIMIVMTVAMGGLVYAARDNHGVRVFVAMTKAIMTGSPDEVFGRMDPPPIFGDGASTPSDRPARGTAETATGEHKAVFDTLFGGNSSGNQRSKEDVRTTRGTGHDQGGGGIADKIFSNSGSSPPSFQTSRDRGAESGSGSMPRDFTSRGRQTSNVRRITIGK